MLFFEELGLPIPDVDLKGEFDSQGDKRVKS